MILLISDTPVAGTVARLTDWIEKLTGTECHALVRRNYDNNAFHLSAGAFGCLIDWESYLVRCLERARVVIVHNICDQHFIDILFAARSRGTKIIYQVHSPPNEPPQIDYWTLRRNAFDAVFVVAQGHGRFVQGATLVPNIISDVVTTPVVPTRSNIIFVPHMRSTSFRWSNKFSNYDLQNLRPIEANLNGFLIRDIKQIFRREIVTHEEITFFMKSVAIVLDDINTGLIHQTSLEAIKAGCVVMSAADLYAMEEFSITTKAPPPPFIRVNGIEEVKDRLIRSDLSKLVNSNLGKMENYSKKYLGEERLARLYMQTLARYIN